ncbi:SDR family oxidoreductase [Brevundimonas sp.]|uniref:SDR family oxidoreductase n=1 Tax=Brevundimonas sp. TaxID=1871086 RepID=UPI002EDAF22A
MPRTAPRNRPDGGQRDSRSVVVTGGSAGVGRAIALRFARNGARVAVLGRSRSGVEAAAREIEAAGGEALALAVDVSDAAAVAAAADEVARRWGGIDVWVNNAMATMYAPVAQMSAAEFRRITEVTYLGCVHGTMAALTHMRRRDAGVVIQIGSALSYRAIPLQSAYCGAKFAIRGFTEALRSELRRERSGVRISMLQLPAVNTPQFDWARNLFPRRPRPVAPIFQPEAVAEIAWRAARDAPREVWIGLPTLKLIAGSVLAPEYLDRYLAGEGHDAQLSQQAEPPDRADNLFEPVEGAHRTRGRFTGEAKPSVTAFDPMIVRLAAAGAAGVLAGLAGWAARRVLS